MNLINFLLILISTFSLVFTQILLKLWLNKYSFQLFPLNKDTLLSLFNLEFVGAGLSFLIGGVIWLGLLKRIEFSILYPLISISYIFGLLAAKYIFNENIPFLRWLGVLVIILGVLLVTKK